LIVSIVIASSEEEERSIIIIIIAFSMLPLEWKNIDHKKNVSSLAPFLQ